MFLVNKISAWKEMGKCAKKYGLKLSTNEKQKSEKQYYKKCCKAKNLNVQLQIALDDSLWHIATCMKLKILVFGLKCFLQLRSSLSYQNFRIMNVQVQFHVRSFSWLSERGAKMIIYSSINLSSNSCTLVELVPWVAAFRTTFEVKKTLISKDIWFYYECIFLASGLTICQHARWFFPQGVIYKWFWSFVLMLNVFQKYQMLNHFYPEILIRLCLLEIS